MPTDECTCLTRNLAILNVTWKGKKCITQIVNTVNVKMIEVVQASCVITPMVSLR